MSDFKASDGKQVRKSGQELADARKLREALKETDLRFKQVIDRALRVHRRIADNWFFQDCGIELMRMDSAVALDVLHHFALKGIPALSVHDSFIVPEFAASELEDVMRRTYRQRVGFDPVVARGVTESLVSAY